jgi:enoyl-CoA hydratase/carnithine racemase
MRFFMPAARFGLHYYPSGLRRYTQKVSPSFAKRAFMLAEDFTDEDLLRVGYLDWLVERSEFKVKVDETAAKLAGLAPLSMSNMKRPSSSSSGRPRHSKIHEASASARRRRTCARG